MIQPVRRDVVWKNLVFSIYDAKVLLTPSAYTGIWGHLFDEGDLGGQLYLLLPQQANTQEVVEAMRCVGTWDEVVHLSGRIRGPTHAMGPKKLAAKLNIHLVGSKPRHRRGKRHKLRPTPLYDASEEAGNEAIS